MKLKNALLMNEQFLKLLKDFSSYRFSPSIALGLIKRYNALEAERKMVNETKNAIVKKYGKGDEKVGYSISPDDKAAMDAFGKEFMELLNIEFDFPFEKLVINGNVMMVDPDTKKQIPVLFTIGEIALLSEIIEFDE